MEKKDIKMSEVLSLKMIENERKLRCVKLFNDLCLPRV